MSYNVLTQVIIPPSTAQHTGANLFFAKKGQALVVTIGLADENGLPKNELATVRLEPAQIAVDAPTKVTWPAPLLLQAGVAYALSVNASDTDTALQVAQVGEASLTGGYVTQPPAQIGALLHTSESGVVTKYTNRYMRLELLTVQFKQTAQTFVVGKKAVNNATTLTINAGAVQPVPEARVTYQLKLFDAGGALKATHDVDVSQPIRLSAPHTGSVQVEATLRRASNGLAPVLEPGTVLIVGTLQTTGIYITPAIQLAGGTTLTAVFRADLPSGSTVTLESSTDGGTTWATVPFESSSPQTAGTVELTHKKTGLTGTAVRLRMRLTGTTNARPQVPSLYAVVL